MLRLHLEMLDARALQNGTMLDSDSKTYLAWSNSYVRTVARLGVDAAAPPTASLADLLADMDEDHPEIAAPPRPRGRPRKVPLDLTDGDAS